MINGFSQSPINCTKSFRMERKLEKNELLIREIIDIDSAYIEGDEIEDEYEDVKKQKQRKKEKNPSKKQKKSRKKNKNEEEKCNETKNQEYAEEDEFNPTLAAMEEEIKPQVISTINNL